MGDRVALLKCPSGGDLLAFTPKLEHASAWAGSFGRRSLVPGSNVVRCGECLNGYDSPIVVDQQAHVGFHGFHDGGLAFIRSTKRICCGGREVVV